MNILNTRRGSQLILMSVLQHLETFWVRDWRRDGTFQSHYDALMGLEAARDCIAGLAGIRR